MRASPYEIPVADSLTTDLTVFIVVANIERTLEFVKASGSYRWADQLYRAVGEPEIVSRFIVPSNAPDKYARLGLNETDWRTVNPPGNLSEEELSELEWQHFKHCALSEYLRPAADGGKWYVKSCGTADAVHLPPQGSSVFERQIEYEPICNTFDGAGDMLEYRLGLAERYADARLKMFKTPQILIRDDFICGKDPYDDIRPLFSVGDVTDYGEADRAVEARCAEYKKPGCTLTECIDAEIRFYDWDNPKSFRYFYVTNKNDTASITDGIKRHVGLIKNRWHLLTGKAKEEAEADLKEGLSVLYAVTANRLGKQGSNKAHLNTMKGGGAS